MRAWFGLAEKFNWHKARAIGPLITVTGTLIVGGLFSLAIVAAFKLLGAAVFSEVPQDGFAKFGLTGIIVAMIGAPFVVWRSAVAQRQVGLVDQALTNDKMDNAVADLHAQRQVTLGPLGDGTFYNAWEDDITRRNGAIDRLEGLVAEDRTLAPRVSRMLSVYVRELTREISKPGPDEADQGANFVTRWADGQRQGRSDMEKAVQTLGRLPVVADGDGNLIYPDLQGANLRGMRLTGLNFQNANLIGAQLLRTNLYRANLLGADLRDAQLPGAYLSGAQLKGADLSWAQLQGAHLVRAKLLGSDLSWAELQRAHLSGAQLQGADLTRAQLQGADLRWAQFDADTNLSDASLRGAALRHVDFTNVPQIADHLDEVFGDSTVTLPDGMERPARFDVKYDNHSDFRTAWRAFQRSIGQNLADPK